MVKQVIIVRNDLKMGKGKIAAQACHASLGVYKKVKKQDKKLIGVWETFGEKKVVLSANLEELMEFKKWADGAKIPSYMVKDAGHTQLKPGTITALGIGPDSDEKLEPTERLKLL
ncbi:MAG: peptidyl-tRNA hydrolase [Candidatus Altiarchaeota archaeon]|nr:peptidyl-tRNA hydrolase [Candidatus Altiarchaeota archaeon]